MILHTVVPIEPPLFAHAFAGIAACFHIWLSDFPLLPVGLGPIGERIRRLGYHEVYCVEALYTENILPFLPRRLIWYTLAHGSRDGRLWGSYWWLPEELRWEFPFIFFTPFVLLSPECLPPGLNYKLVVLSACYAGRGSKRWSEEFGGAVVIGWEGRILIGALRGFDERFFEALNRVDKEGRSVTVEYAFEYALQEVQRFRQVWKPVLYPPEKGNLRIKLH